MSVNTQNILVICDSGFGNLCSTPLSYIERLKTIIGERTNNDYALHTVSGKYGLGDLDESITVMEIEDRNKTSFVQTIENMAHLTSELIIISIVDHDPHIEALASALSERCITIRRYKYQRKAA
ncbi:phage protein [Vibrio phage pTD1]|uniref:Phage protein n=1 Tax=Vibrio phage pTD1 TaxID=1938577 RepID=A0A1Q2U377_9CAUD|nr:phage protein [Vibrio phage pTD1]BAW98412.1 phage protein [Vibrio phage pTD1]